MGVDEAERARGVAQDVARRSYGKLIAFLAARTRDVAAAEDALSEAFVAALADWPVHGCPSNPEAWLFTAARRRVIDQQRKRRNGEAVAIDLQVLAEALDSEAFVVDDTVIPDQRLALLFACAHPAIAAEARAPLMLQTVLGLDAQRIASAFLVAPATMGKRLVRAKSRIRATGIAFRVPDADELPARLDVVLDAIYAAFGVGWNDPQADAATGGELTDEALFLAALVAHLLPAEPEALGLLALMLHVHARRDARRDGEGRYVPLADQDAMCWDSASIERAEALLHEAVALRRVGRYQLEAALQSAHVARGRMRVDNRAAVVRLYDHLQSFVDSPVVRLNRAIAIADLDGARTGLALLDTLAQDARLADYQPYWAARADLAMRAGDAVAAHHAYGVAIGLARDAAVRRFLMDRRASIAH